MVNDCSKLCACISITLSHTAILTYYIGVYLSLNNKPVQPDDGVIFITDIGTSSPNQLVCTSDRIPCCQDHGGWYFPNKSEVMNISNKPTPTAFHTDRNGNGEVNLYRVNSDVVSPTGYFCCKTIDATDSNHTLCVYLCKYNNLC